MEMNFSDLNQITDVQQACSKFGQLLGLSDPVPPQVLYAAIEDEDYARNLLLARRNAQLLAHLLQQPQAVAVKEAEVNRQIKYNSLQLIGKAAKAFINWSKTGFSTVDDYTYQKRMSACERCDQLEKAPDLLVYTISLKKGEDKRTCKSCGCVVSRKARLSSDTCPLEDAGNPGFNRWGEPR